MQETNCAPPLDLPFPLNLQLDPPFPRIVHLQYTTPQYHSIQKYGISGLRHPGVLFMFYVAVFVISYHITLCNVEILYITLLSIILFHGLLMNISDRKSDCVTDF